MTQNQVEARTFIPASVILQELHDTAPADYFTLGWLMDRLWVQAPWRLRASPAAATPSLVGPLPESVEERSDHLGIRERRDEWLVFLC